MSGTNQNLIKMQNEFTQLIDKLATKLGTTAEYLWSVLLVQAKIQAITDTVILICMAAVLAFGIKKISQARSLYKDSYDSFDENWYAGWIIGTIIWTIVFLIAFLGSINSIINGFFNPEFWALDTIFNAMSAE